MQYADSEGVLQAKSSLRASSRPPSRKSAPVHFAEDSDDDMKVDSDIDQSEDEDNDDA